MLPMIPGHIHAGRARKLAWLPPVLLGAYAFAYGHVALGGGMLAYDDHPGQLYRVFQALSLGLAPWRFNPGWWAGYAELQYYPPAFAWLGAALHWISLRTLGPFQVYELLLWIAWLLPGATTYLFLRRALGNAWLALPGAFLSLTLSARSSSGVEEGLYWGMVAARLGLGALPLVAWSLLDWAEGRGRLPIGAAPFLAGVILLHPTHGPAAAVLVWLAAANCKPRLQRLAHGLGIVALGLGLAAIWLVPLAAHIEMTLPLAFADISLPSLGLRFVGQPLLLFLTALNVIGGCLAFRNAAAAGRARRRRQGDPAVVVIGLLDVLLVRSFGIAWLPPDRLLDGLYMGLILGASLTIPKLAAKLPAPATAGVTICTYLFISLVFRPPAEPDLSIWPAPHRWHKYVDVQRSVGMEPLWAAIRRTPPGRVLFLESAVSLGPRSAWYRAHSHITALTPIMTDRDILSGTFTHPSPVAGLFYSGSADGQPIRLLAEQRDNVTVWGRRIESFTAGEFNTFARLFAISSVVATEESLKKSSFLTDNPSMNRPEQVGTFYLVSSLTPRPLPIPSGTQRWTWTLLAHPGGRAVLPFAYSPLWVARAGGSPLPIDRSPLGLLEVEAGRGDVVIQLEHRAGGAEWAGVALSLLSLLAVSAICARAR